MLGITFLICEYVPGLIISNPAQAQHLTSSESDLLCGSLIQTLPQLHGIQPTPLPPGRSHSARQYLDRQVLRWIQQWQRTQTRNLPAFDRLARWLQDEVARLTADYPVTFVHSDYRLDNLVLDPSSASVRAVLDWEMPTFGDPLMDVALLLVYWEERGDGRRQSVNVARNLTTASDGFWSRGQLLREYIAATNLPMDHLNVCLGLAGLKLAVIVESVHYRYLSGQALDDLSSGLGDAAPALLDMGLAVASGRGIAGLAA